jgi:four helix bundle protein
MPQPDERFDAWQPCHQLTLEVYRATSRWPKGELFGLTRQARRAAASAAIDLVEGSAKRGVAEFRRYLDIANGSLAEVGYILRLGRDLELLSEPQWALPAALRERAAQAVWGLYRSLRRRRAS